MPPPAGGPRDGPDGGDNPTVTIPGLNRELKEGDSLTAEECEAIAKASGGKLKFDGKNLTGENPDGSGPVNIEVGKELNDGEIHDLHHTVKGSGGAGNSGGGGHH